MATIRSPLDRRVKRRRHHDHALGKMSLTPLLDTFVCLQDKSAIGWLVVSHWHLRHLFHGNPATHTKFNTKMTGSESERRRAMRKSKARPRIFVGLPYAHFELTRTRRHQIPTQLRLSPARMSCYAAARSFPTFFLQATRQALTHFFTLADSSATYGSEYSRSHNFAVSLNTSKRSLYCCSLSFPNPPS